MPLSQNIDWNSGVLGLLSLTLQVATLNLKGIFAKDLVLNFYMELTGDLFHRHSIFHCQLNDLLYLLLFRLTRLAGRLWSQDLLLLSLQRFDAFPGCGDLRIILCHNRLFLLFQLFDALVYLCDFFVHLSCSLLRGTARALILGLFHFKITFPLFINWVGL